MGRILDAGRVYKNDVGVIAASGKAYFYTTGTTTLKLTYSDTSLSTQNANPLTLKSDGRLPAEVFGRGSYTVRVNDVNGALAWTEDDLEPPEKIYSTPEDHGALGAPADDTTALAALFAAGGLIKFDQAKTYMTDPLTTTTAIYVECVKGAVLKRNALTGVKSADDWTLKIATDGSTWNGGTFDGNRDPNTQYFTNVNAFYSGMSVMADNVRVENVHFQQCVQDGLLVYGDFVGDTAKPSFTPRTGLYINNITSDDCGRGGVHIEYADNSDFLNFRATDSDNRTTAEKATPGSDPAYFNLQALVALTCDGCRFENWVVDGMDGTDFSVINSNVSSFATGILMDQITNYQVSNLTVLDMKCMTDTGSAKSMDTLAISLVTNFPGTYSGLTIISRANLALEIASSDSVNYENIYIDSLYKTAVTLNTYAIALKGGSRDPFPDRQRRGVSAGAGNTLRNVRVVRGYHGIAVRSPGWHLIDCDVSAMIAHGYRIGHLGLEPNSFGDNQNVPDNTRLTDCTGEFNGESTFCWVNGDEVIWDNCSAGMSGQHFGNPGLIYDSTNSEAAAVTGGEIVGFRGYDNQTDNGTIAQAVSFLSQSVNILNSQTQTQYDNTVVVNLIQPDALGLGQFIGLADSYGLSISAISEANPGVMDFSSVHGLTSGDKIVVTGIGGMVELNETVLTVTVTDTDSVTIGVDTSTGHTTYTSGGRAGAYGRIIDISRDKATIGVESDRQLTSANLLTNLHTGADTVTTVGRTVTINDNSGGTDLTVLVNGSYYVYDNTAVEWREVRTVDSTSQLSLLSAEEPFTTDRAASQTYSIVGGSSGKGDVVTFKTQTYAIDTDHADVADLLVTGARGVGNTTALLTTRLASLRAGSDFPAAVGEIVTATNIITAEETGKTFFLNSGTEFVSTLPLPAQGLRYTFIVTAAPSGAAYTVVTASSANIMEVLLLDIVGELVYATGRDVVTFADGVALVGDRLEVTSDGTNWYCTALSGANGGITTGQT